MSLEPGDTVDDKYRILRHIGSGGMGDVYEGEYERIHRRVAIKVLNAKLAAEREFVRRFEHEAQAAGRIGSEHVVEVLDVGELPRGERYMVMEFLEGESLRMRMERVGAMSPEDIFPIVIGLLDGMCAAHAAGILHRDLKPANVFLTCNHREPDFVKILDFGISKFMHLGTDEVTETGVMLGTPRYMSPEQARGEKEVDERADIYSVGVILYRALTARAPYTADTYNELLFKVVLEDPPSLSTLVVDADPGVIALVHRAMSRDREARFQSADEMAEALRGWLEAHGFEVPPRSRRTAQPPSSLPPGSRRGVRTTGSPPDNTTSTKMTTSVFAHSRRPRSVASRAALWILGGLALIAGGGYAALSQARGGIGDAETLSHALAAAAREALAARADPSGSPSPTDSAPTPPASASAPTESAPANVPPKARAAPTPARSASPSEPTRKYRRKL